MLNIGIIEDVRLPGWCLCVLWDIYSPYTRVDLPRSSEARSILDFCVLVVALDVPTASTVAATQRARSLRATSSERASVF